MEIWIKTTLVKNEWLKYSMSGVTHVLKRIFFMPDFLCISQQVKSKRSVQFNVQTFF